MEYWNFILGCLIWLIAWSYLVIRICNLKREVVKDWKLKSTWFVEELLEKHIEKTKHESPSK